jgi:hypothetical protein
LGIWDNPALLALESTDEWCTSVMSSRSFLSRGDSTGVLKSRKSVSYPTTSHMKHSNLY